MVSFLPGQVANGVVAENMHPFDDEPIEINYPKGLFILSGGSMNRCAFSASTIKLRARISILAIAGQWPVWLDKI